MAFPGSAVNQAFDDDWMTIRDQLGIKDKLITHFDDGNPAQITSIE